MAGKTPMAAGGSQKQLCNTSSSGAQTAMLTQPHGWV